jgi:hypothetical protein
MECNDWIPPYPDSAPYFFFPLGCVPEEGEEAVAPVEDDSKGCFFVQGTMK